jgi:adenylyltransferase/sulfurtransferase
VVGVMGVLQALEAIKVIVAGLGRNNMEAKASFTPSLLLFSANGTSTFRSVKLRPRRQHCFACSADAGLSSESLTSGSLDYVLFCGATSPVNLLGPEDRVEAKEYAEVWSQVGKEHLLIDVREKVQFDICHLEGSINVPFSSLSGATKVGIEGQRPKWLPEIVDDVPIYLVCRLGNDSQIAAQKFKEALGEREIKDIRGGLRSWKHQVDSEWPEY